MKLKKIKNKYFGTDGFRGEVNVDLNSIHAYKIGRFLGWYYSKNSTKSKKARIVIGKDTRRSSYMIEYSLIAGLTASGADVFRLHVATTPCVAYITKQDNFDCGIMITASHNPYYDNGIKIINKNGEKLDNKTTNLIEQYLDGELNILKINNNLPFAVKDKIGQITDYSIGKEKYINFLTTIPYFSYKKFKIGLDCANGASWELADRVFKVLGAQTELLGVEPNGLNINKNVGSTNISSLQKLVIEKHLDFGFAFDGDCDRCIAVDEKGNVVNGDKILYMLAKNLQSKNKLNNNTVVSTVMSNSGFISALKKLGITSVQTKVGDRFVYESMKKNDFSLGGEESGHIILKDLATTGDGLLTAIMLTEAICESNCPLSLLHENVKLYPQLTKNVTVKNKEKIINDKIIKKEIKTIEKEINGNGRVLLRPSGTEPVVRIMIENNNIENCKIYANKIAETIILRDQ